MRALMLGATLVVVALAGPVAADRGAPQGRQPAAVASPRPPQAPGAPRVPPRDRSGRPQALPVEGTAVISGRIVDAETGQPLRRAAVQAYLTSTRSARDAQSHLTRTDDAGGYAFEKLPAGVYGVRVQRAGYVSDASGADSRRLAVDDGQRLSGVDFRLHRGGVIAGRVTDDAGEVAEGVMVRVLRATRVRGRDRFVATGGRPSMTDDLGNFRVYGLPPGEYLLAAEPSSPRGGPTTVIHGDRLDLIATYAPGTPSPADAVRLTVTAGQTASMDIQLVASRVVNVSGRVVDSSGAPLEAGMVRLRPDGADIGPRGSSGSPVMQGGTFRIAGLAPGPYTLQAQARPRAGPLASTGDAARLESARLSIVLGSADLDGLVITTSPPSTASGRIVIEGDATKIDANDLRVFGRSLEPDAVSFGPGGQGRVGADLTFTVGSLSGPSTITVAGLPRGWWLKTVRLNGRDALEGFDFDTGRRWTGLEIVLNDRPASIGGQVTDGNGRPATDVQVLVFPVDFVDREITAVQGLTGRGMLDQNGGFVVERMRPGDYFVVVLPNGDTEAAALGDPERLQAFSERAERVTLDEGDMPFINLIVR